tara:strand:+ start:276 stop:1547 length:1272 start_codon:yes stop_codon:yes gene_type:complete
MKGFSQFLVEAETSKAAAEAKRLQLTSDGHGGWTDRSGKYVAKTEGGKLVFFKGRGGKQDDDKSPAKRPAPEAIKRKVSPKPADQKAAVKTKDPELKPPSGTEKPDEVDQAEGDTVTVAFGRFNPPTIGHEKLMKAADKVALGGPLKIYPSRTQDSKKNPLDPDMKISFMKKMFPDFEENIINDGEMKSIFNVLIAASEEGYKNVNIVVGADRQAEFENLATKYNGELYKFDDIRVVSAGVRDADAEGVEGMSASKMRKAVVDGDFKSFKTGTPKSIKDADIESIFNAVKSGMKVKKTKVTELWQIAPKYDAKGLREQYVSGKLYRLGDIVENLNTGLIGKIIRRGTNHLICVTEENHMFKSWIRDVMEYTEVKMSSRMRDKTHPNYLVGTSGYRKNVMDKMGMKKITNFNIKEFINKYKLVK